MSKYTPNPQTVEEAIGNVSFQLENVIGWNSVGKMEEVSIKADCLLDAAKLLVKMLEQKSTPIPEPI